MARGPKVVTPRLLQFQMTECGTAALGIIFAYYGFRPSLEELRARTGVSRDGLNALAIVKAAREAGFEARVFSLEPEQLTSKPLPLLLHMSFGHFAVLEGLDEERAWLNDPSCGRVCKPRKEFDEDFTGIAIAISPGPEALRRDDRVPLAPRLIRRLAMGGRALAIAAGARFGRLAAFAALACVLGPSMAGELAPRLGLMAGLWLGLLALIALEQLAAERARRAIEERSSAALIDALRVMPYVFFTYRVPDKLEGLLARSRDIAASLTGAPLRVALGLFAAPLLLLGIAALSPGLAAIASFALATALAARLSERSAVGDTRLYRFSEEQLGWAATATLSNLEGVKTGPGSSAFLSGLIGGLAEQARLLGCALTSQVEARSLVRVAELGGLLGAACWGLHTGLPLGSLITAVLLIVALFDGFSAFSWVELDALTEALDIQDEVLTLAASSTLRLPEGEAAEPTQSGEAPLRARGLCFGFNRKRAPLFEGLTFEIAPSEQVALVGASGGGKSTFAALLCGLLEPWSGEVRHGGGLSWVAPRPFLFEGSLRDNLKLWDSSISDEALERAITDAALREVVAERGGLDAPVSARGLNFSSGQRQRIEVARALCRDPKVLILDEAIDALELDLEESLRVKLRARGVAVLIVSHREETIARSDRVLRLSPKGLVEESSRSTAGAGARSPTEAWPEDERSLRPEEAAEGLRALGRLAPEDEGLQRRIGEASNLDEAPSSLLAAALRAGVGVYDVRPLRRDWYGDELPPLVGRRRDGRFVSLSPQPFGGALMAVEGEDAARPLEAEAAAELEAELYGLIPAAPSADASPRSLLREALGGAGHSFMRMVALSLLAGGGSLGALLALALGFEGARLFGAPMWLLFIVAALAAWLARRAGALEMIRAQILIEQALLPRLWAAVLDRPILAVRRLGPRKLSLTIEALRRRGLADSASRFDLVLAPAAALSGALLLLSAPALAMVLAALSAPLWLPLLRRSAGAQETRAARVAADGFLFEVFISAARLLSLGAFREATERWLAMDRRAAALAEQEDRIEAWRARAAEAWPLLCVAAAGLVIAALYPGAPRAFSLFAAGLMLSEALLGLAQGLGSLRSFGEAVDALGPALDEAPEPPGKVSLRLSGRIEARDLSLRFPEARAPIIAELSLDIRAGEVVAICGPSGSGKSTLLRALLGTLPLEAGELRFDGVPLWEIGRSSFQSQIGFVSQEERLFSANIRQNISNAIYGGLLDIERALSLACLMDELRLMPRGLLTHAAEGQISTGQKQRVLIARALCKRPRLLLLDEATSALQVEMEAQLLDNLRREGITTILATHRLHTRALADRVLCFVGGRLIPGEVAS